MVMDVIVGMMIPFLYLLRPQNAIHLVSAIQRQFVEVLGDCQYMDQIKDNHFCIC